MVFPVIVTQASMAGGDGSGGETAFQFDDGAPFSGGISPGGSDLGPW